MFHVLVFPTIRQEERKLRKMQLEKQIANLPEQDKQNYRAKLAEDEALALKESRKKTTTADFESLAVVGRGAFGTFLQLMLICIF